MCVLLFSLQDGDPIRTQFSLGKFEIKQVGTKFMLSVKNLTQKDSGEYTLQVGDKKYTVKLNVKGMLYRYRNHLFCMRYCKIVQAY